MPGRSSIKDPELCEKLRAQGASQEKAARITNAAAARGRESVAAAGGRSGTYGDWTVPQLRRRAKELGLSGYSDKKKSDLIEALREH